MATVRESIQRAHRTLEDMGIPDARLEAEVMVMNVMRMPRQDLFARQEDEATTQHERDIDEILERRRAREPLAYILGYREFYGINLLVNSDVLIPRPETETMVEHALFMSLMGMESSQLVIADVGTGTGAIAINLAIHLPAARIYAVDLTDPVLNVANYNIRSHNVADRVTLRQGDLLEPVPEPVDLVVANLPYIPTERIPTLQPEVQWEPRIALDGGADGLDPARRLLFQATTRLKEQGVILLELDPEQMETAAEAARQNFPDADVSVEQDLARRDRILVVTRGLEG